MRSRNISEVRFNIYDRAGNLVYQTHDVEEAASNGWNGGKHPSGVYVWSLRLRYNNGDSVTAQGKVNLIR
ncbi:MAG: hypothetical protein HC880_17960 [Bacteroidia bacterium]|nr:hypothetical protein [Bacteroidia bacterium]